MVQVNLVEFFSLPAFTPFRLKGREIVSRWTYPGERRFRRVCGFSLSLLFRHVILLVVLIQLYRLAEDKKNAPSALTRANSAHIHVRGTTLLRCSLARTAFLGANTPLLCNGSSRWQLLLLTRAPFRHHGSRGSFSLPPTLACTIRQFSAAGRPTYFPRSTPFCCLYEKYTLLCDLSSGNFHQEIKRLDAHLGVQSASYISLPIVCTF